MHACSLCASFSLTGKKLEALLPRYKRVGYKEAAQQGWRVCHLVGTETRLEGKTRNASEMFYGFHARLVNDHCERQGPSTFVSSCGRRKG